MQLPSAYTAQDWVNVDRAAIEGVDEVCNLFAYPWLRSTNASPWSDDCAEEILCSHIIEHIPHEAKLNPGAGNFPGLIETAMLDGFYGFMYECWRILKPNGFLHIIAPYGLSVPGIGDPTHHRLLGPGTFSYMTPNPTAPFDYQLPMQFKLTDILLRPRGPLQQALDSWEDKLKQMDSSPLSAAADWHEAHGHDAKHGEWEEWTPEKHKEWIRYEQQVLVEHNLGLDEFYVKLIAIKDN